MLDLRSTLSEQLLDEFQSFCKVLCEETRRVFTEFSQKEFTIEQKPDESFVSSVDKSIESHLRKVIQQSYPAHGILGEEYGSINKQSDYQWIIDPIDGTEEFIRGLPYFGTIIALMYKTMPVLGIIDHPALNVCCYAVHQRGAYVNGKIIDPNLSTTRTLNNHLTLALPAFEDFVRHSDEADIFTHLTSRYPNYRVFRSCYGHTATILGMLDATVEWNVKLWDIAASRILIEEAGGQYVELRKKHMNQIGNIYSVLFGKPAAVEIIENTLREAMNL